MRKLKLQMQISIDGFVSTGPNDEQRWVTWAWDEIAPQVLALNSGADTMVIGRKLAVDFVPYWLEVAKRPQDPMNALAKIIVGFRKVIFTKTLEKSDWINTEVNQGDLVSEIEQLKRQPGRDIMVVGGSSFVADLIKAGLVDEFHLFVNPVALGKGEAIFGGLNGFAPMRLVNSITYDCGIVMLHYEKFRV